jgi:prophage regulatory protein
MDRTSLSRTSLWRMMRRRDFPQSITISPGRIAWPESQVNAWIAARLSQSTEGVK